MSWKQIMQSLSLLETIYIFKHCLYSWKHSLPLSGLDPSHLSGTSSSRSTKAAAIPRMKLKGVDKAKILRGAEVKIFPFTNRKHTGINTIMFLPISELSSSMIHHQPFLTPSDTLWAAGWVIKAQDPEFPLSNWNGWMKRIHASGAKHST